MKIVGILTEFNPFHNGHAYFLSELRRQLGENAGILCVMSGNFVQRGEPAMFPKHVRAEAALLCGADLVVELPVARSLASAEGFARGAVYLMQCLGCVTHLAFGSECGDVAALQRVADCLDSERCCVGLRRFLNEGMPFAACRQAVVREILGEKSAALLDGANNNLGVEYLRAARHLKWDCTVLTVARRGAGHDSGAVKGEYLSASAVRKLLEQGDWTAAAAAVPPETMDLYRGAFAAGRAPVTLQEAERLLLEQLRTMDREAFAALPDCTEGLHHRLYRAAREAVSFEEWLERAKTKRYARSRLRRIAMCAWLGISSAATEAMPAYLRLLGCNERGRAILAQARAAARLPVLVKPADVKKLPDSARMQFALEARATERCLLACPGWKTMRPGEEWRMGPVVLEK